MARPPPFDPIRGAWVLLLALVVTVLITAVLRFLGCTVFAVQPMCEPFDNMRDITLELIAGIALLISQRRP